MCIPIQPVTCHPLRLGPHFVEVQHTTDWLAVKVDGATLCQVQPNPDGTVTLSGWDKAGKPAVEMTTKAKGE